MQPRYEGVYRNDNVLVVDKVVSRVVGTYVAQFGRPAMVKTIPYI